MERSASVLDQLGQVTDRRSGEPIAPWRSKEINRRFTMASETFSCSTLETILPQWMWSNITPKRKVMVELISTLRRAALSRLKKKR